MNLSKSINLLSGLLLLGCGVLACFYPEASASYYGIELSGLEAKTTIRVVGGLFIGIGLLFLVFAYQLKEQKPLLLCLIVIMASFALSRLLGLLVDGFDQPLMVYELAFEVLFLALVAWIYRREEMDCKINTSC